MNLQSTEEEIIKKNTSESIAEKWHEQNPNKLDFAKEIKQYKQKDFLWSIEWKRTRNWMLSEHTRGNNNLGMT